MRRLALAAVVAGALAMPGWAQEPGPTEGFVVLTAKGPVVVYTFIQAFTPT